MRKILMGVLVALMLVGSAFVAVQGVEKLNLYGFNDITEKNNEIDNKNSELSNVITVTYTNTESNLKQTAKKLTDTKTEYENQAILVAESAGSSYALKTEKYDIDYLWTKLGNYAKDEGVGIKIDVKANAADSRYYDLNFTVAGSYVGITDFIYDIENDSKLGYKIEDFSMYTINNDLQANFSCKDIAIDVGKIDTKTTTADDKNNDSKDNTRTNNANTTNGTSSSNSNTSTRATTSNSSTNANNTKASGNTLDMNNY